MKKNPLLDRSFDFAIQIVLLCRNLSERKEFIISRQLLKSGTSVGANIEEAMAASSKRDFAYRMSIACRECRETRYWLRLMQATSMIDMDLNATIAESTELIKILTKIVKPPEKHNHETSPLI